MKARVILTGNVACFLLMFGADVARGGVERALRVQNHDPLYPIRTLAVMERLAQRGVR